SLVAVFLALGVGIVMGATVIDRVTASELRTRLKEVNAARHDRAQLEGQQRTMQRWIDQARGQLFHSNLKGVPVVVVGVRGVDRSSVDQLLDALVDAQADVRGALWLTKRLRLDNPGEVNALATAMGVPDDQPDRLRRLAL